MQAENESKLRKLVVKWTEFFRWRKDFLKWREERIWQEKYQGKTINFLEKFIPDLKNKKILDLGCGMGGFLVAMKRREYDIQGLEPNPDYCEITKLRGKRYNLEVEVINGFGEKMPFEDHSFNFIYCNDVLEHCEDPEELLKESYRLLKPKGQMYVTVINRFGFKDPHYHLRFINWLPRFLGEIIIKLKGFQREDSTAGKQKLSNMHYFIYWQFKNLTKKIGFKILDLQEYKISHPELISDPKNQKIAKTLKLFKLNSLFYFLMLFYLSGFNFLL
jgi:ubiquinone/menaquinone biosynthesis C-methylase UbiE